VRAFAFLGTGGTDYLSGMRWPAPVGEGLGPWLDPGRSSPAVRACTVEQLPWWLDQELWAVELAGGVEDTGRSLLAERGRLLERVGTWNAAAADELRWACTARLRALAVSALRREGRDREAALLERDDGPDAIASAAQAAAEGTGDASQLAGFTAEHRDLPGSGRPSLVLHGASRRRPPGSRETRLRASLAAPPRSACRRPERRRARAGLAIARGVTIDDIASGHYVFPTLGEAVHYAAEAAVRASAPSTVPA
jgi:hypothetical protein